jgi:hypothetical protein
MRVNDFTAMRPWPNKFAVVAFWLIAGWVAWDFLQWVDPPRPRDPIAHPLRITL